MHYIEFPLSRCQASSIPVQPTRERQAARLLFVPAMDDESSRTKVDGCMPPTIVARDVHKSFGNGRTATPWSCAASAWS